MSKQLDIFEFGEQLLETRDLDPVYVLLWAADFEHPKLCHWLFAYWCFYHCGTASWIVDQPDFWPAMAAAAATAEHPRASERRHFRGQAAIRAVQEARGACVTPVDLIQRWGFQVWDSESSERLSSVMDTVKTLRGFGDWIAFKVADMLERLHMSNIEFKSEDVFYMFDAPRKGAEEMARRHNSDTDDVYTWAHDSIIDVLGKFCAPPGYERLINVQEVETILCKWKSHLNGHYHVGKDIAEIKHGLMKYAKVKTSQQLLRAGREEDLW